MKKRKILKISAISLILFIGILVAVPFIFKGKIIDLIKQNLNNNLNAKVDFQEADLSVFRDFPNATVTLSNTSIINRAPFSNDTLFHAEEIELKMGIGELFKDASEVIRIQSFKVNQAHLRLLINEQGVANYDIAKESENADTTGKTESRNFEFSVDGYEITNAHVYYKDLSTGIALRIDSLQHRGEGDLSLEKSELNTISSALLSFEMDSVNYLNRNPIKLDALLGIDLKENKYRFLKNEATVNQLSLYLMVS